MSDTGDMKGCYWIGAVFVILMILPWILDIVAGLGDMLP